MIPLYGFLEGDVIGLVVLADEQDSMAELTRKLQGAADLRVAPLRAPGVWVHGARLEPNATVASAGLKPLDRFDVRSDE